MPHGNAHRQWHMLRCAVTPQMLGSCVLCSSLLPCKQAQTGSNELKAEDHLAFPHNSLKIYTSAPVDTLQGTRAVLGQSGLYCVLCTQ